MVAAVCSYLVAYRFYSRFIGQTVFGLDPTRATPAERFDNGRDFVPTSRWVLFGHHFSAISGAGPLVGPTLAAQFGFLPGTIWLIAGVVLGGAVQDFLILCASMRRDGKSLGQIAKEEVNPVAGLAAMVAIFAIMIILLAVDTTVLVYGESGTGKEFVVRLIHDQSPRAAAPFVSINCAALTETLLESELFGHVRGAFTGAVRDKAGLFEVAGEGTIFLDEIGEVAPTVQAKLLRALQEREIRRVGGERNIKINARVVAATNRVLREAVEAGTFREDLYFRLGAFIIEVPPLRERREDIPPLVHGFMVRAASRMKKDVRAISADAMSAVMNYRWPGNVRELEHAIERAVILANAASIRLRDLPPEITQTSRRRPGDDTLDLQEQERASIERALERFGGNRRRAAEALNISTVTLWRRMKQFRLSP